MERAFGRHLYSILKNPAYAGAFAYGRRAADPTRQVSGRPSTGKIHQPQPNGWRWSRTRIPRTLVREEFEKIQQTIEENRAAHGRQDQPPTRAAPGSALLTGLVRCGRCGHAMQVTYSKGIPH